MTVRGGGQTQVATRPGSMIVTNFGSPPGMPTILAQGALNAQLGALEGRRAPAGQRRWRRQRTQPRPGRSEFRSFGRQLRPVGAHRGAGRAGQFRLRPGPAQPQSQRHGRDGAEQRQPGACSTTTAVQDQRAAADSSSSRRRTRRRRLCRHRRRQFPTSFPGGGSSRRRRTAPGSPPVLNLPQTGTRDIRWRHGRARERPFDLYRQLSERLELRPERAEPSPRTSRERTSREPSAGGPRGHFRPPRQSSRTTNPASWS